MHGSSTDGDEARSSAATDNQSLDAKPKIDLSAPQFSPTQYLAVAHGNVIDMVMCALWMQSTSFSGLQSELKELKRATSDKTEQLKALVSAHFDQYLYCHEAVRALDDDIRAHQNENEQLLGSMSNLKQVTDATLFVMLERAKEQRRIRNTISVLNRFRPVFEITNRMKESMQNKDYDKLADDYCRLKYRGAKANMSALKRVFEAAHEIAQAANADLLKHFDDVSLSVADQKRAIAVLNALGFVEKPTLMCLGKQMDYLERKLGTLADERDASVIVKECASMTYRFRSGLWSFICEVFKTPTGSTMSTSQATGVGGITSSEAEAIQEKAWTILSTCTQFIEKNASPPTAQTLRHMNDSFRQLHSLKKCPNASTLNAKIAQLKDSFCDKFREKIVLEFLQQACEATRDKMMQDYFDPIVASLPSLATESCIDLSSDTEPVAPLPAAPVVLSQPSGMPVTKAGLLITEANDVFDGIRNTSMVSSESKIHLHRASILTSCSVDVMHGWETIWNQVGQVLLDMVDDGGENTMPGAGNRSDAPSFRSILTQTFKTHLHGMLSLFLEKLLRSFVTEISPPTTMASIAGSTRNRDGASILFVIVSNCIALRGKCIAKVETWLSLLQAGSAANKVDGAHELRQLVLETETKCVEMYVSLHTGPLFQVLQSGAAEEAQQSRTASNSLSRTASRTNSRTSSFNSADIAMHPSSGGTLSSMPVAASNIPNDGRQYVFNVLLQLITLRSEIETSLGHYPQCSEYVRKVSFQLTSVLGRFLDDSVRALEASGDASEWLRIHLLVETRFFLFGLSEFLGEDTQIQLIALEKALQRAKASEKAALAHVALLNQMKHQTKLYLLALAR